MERASCAGVIHDRLYGALTVSADDARLCQTPELTRLRQVSLSAVPPWTIPTGVCANKFEHSVGVGWLARIVGRRPEFRDIAQDLYAAAISHDVGTPPFSHLSEHFLRRLLKKSHEAYAQDILTGSALAEELQHQGADADRVIALITGCAKPWSDLLNGSMDIDNLDNSLRFVVSMSLLPSDHHPYEPEALASAYRLEKGRMVIDTHARPLVGRWAEVRRVAYQYIYSTANLTPGMMLFRALELAVREDELPESYFRMTDPEAYHYLEERCNARTSRLAQHARHWKYYACVYASTASNPPHCATEAHRGPDHPNASRRLSERGAAASTRERLCVHGDESRLQGPRSSARLSAARGYPRPRGDTPQTVLDGAGLRPPEARSHD